MRRGQKHSGKPLSLTFLTTNLSYNFLCYGVGLTAIADAVMTESDVAYFVRNCVPRSPPFRFSVSEHRAGGTECTLAQVEQFLSESK